MSGLVFDVCDLSVMWLTCPEAMLLLPSAGNLWSFRSSFLLSWWSCMMTQTRSQTVACSRSEIERWNFYLQFRWGPYHARTGVADLQNRTGQGPRKTHTKGFIHSSRVRPIDTTLRQIVAVWIKPVTEYTFTRDLQKSHLALEFPHLICDLYILALSIISKVFCLNFMLKRFVKSPPINSAVRRHWITSTQISREDTRNNTACMRSWCMVGCPWSFTDDSQSVQTRQWQSAETDGVWLWVPVEPWLRLLQNTCMMHTYDMMHNCDRVCVTSCKHM